MKYQIDQSGKIEYTSHSTVVAFSNGKSGSLMIKASSKRKILFYFRDAKKPHMFVYKTFAALVYLLIERERGKSLEINIDREYWGKESLIKDYLLRIIRKQKKIDFPASNISFCLVGKKSKCHLLAISILRKKKKPGRVVNETDILRLIV